MSALGTKGDDSVAAARALIEHGRYMTLATADERGRPWATPVWFAPHELRRLYWVSPTDAGHSHNIRVRPEIGIVIFDSGAPVGTGRGVYMAATAAELAGAELERGIEIPRRSSMTVGTCGRR